MSIAAVIMAGGQGTRMRSAEPKVLQLLCGRSMLDWVLIAAREAGADRVVAVVGPGLADEARLPAGVEVAVQAEPRGTADAVACAKGAVADVETVLVLSGDCPLWTAEALRDLLRAHSSSGACATMVTAELEDPSGYGRVVRDSQGDLLRVAETKVAGDAGPDEMAIQEVNAGVYVFSATALFGALERLQPDNAQGETYLPDVLPALRLQGMRVGLHVAADPRMITGVNTLLDLARAAAVQRRRIAERHLLAGVRIVDPDRTSIDADVEIAADAVIDPGTDLRGATRVAAGARVGPNTTAVDATIGEGASVLCSHIVECDVGPNVSVGPFTYLRPGARLRHGAKAGAFVEVKNATIGAASKVPHLSYIGDADVGDRTNIGAGNITANYDGFHKHRTVIGSGVRTGVDTAFVAPVEVGDNAYTAAGSVVTRNVPAGNLAVARQRQTNIEGYAERREVERSTERSLEGGQ